MDSSKVMIKIDKAEPEISPFFKLHTFFFLAYITQNATEPLSDIMGGNFTTSM